MVTRYGMTEALGQIIYERDAAPLLGDMPVFGARQDFSQETAREIDQAVLEIVDAAFGRATEILKRRQTTLEAGAHALLEQETLSEDALQALVSEATEGGGQVAAGS